MKQNLSSWRFNSGIALITTGVIIYFVSPCVINYMIKSGMILSPNSPSYHEWKEPSIELPTNFYLFNWTNPQDIYNKSIKPKFNEIGPYRYIEKRKKTNLIWNQNGTVTYQQLNTWYIDDRWNTNLDEVVTTINPISLSAAYMVRTWAYLVRKGFSFTLSNLTPKIETTRNVSEFLFDGYGDPLLNLAKTLPFFSNVEFSEWDKFALFYTRNASETFDGIFNVGTGSDTELGHIYYWNYWNRTRYFEDECGIVKGSTGEFYKPYSGEDVVYFFSSNLCRILILEYEKDVEVASIPGKKYIIGERMLDNGTKFPENKCFCSGQCAPSGTFNVSSCRNGSPTFLSLPHFHLADPYYISSVEGLRPEKNKHEFSIILEPNTGIPLEVNAAFQLNMLLQPVPGVSLYEDVPEVYFPIMWMEEKFRISETHARPLKMLQNISVAIKWLSIILICMGSILVVFSFREIRKSNRQEQQYQREQEIPLNSK